MARTLRKPHIDYRAKNGIHHGAMTPVRIVLHDTESHDTAGITDIAGIYNFWVSQGLGYGAQFIVDKDGNIGQGGTVHQEMWHVGNYNGGSVGIEQIGFASYTEAEWKHENLAQLIKVSRLIAWMHKEYAIPIQHDINAGVCTHADVGHAGIDPSGHTDPGPNYPLTMVLWLAQRYVTLGGWSVAEPV